MLYFPISICHRQFGVRYDPYEDRTESVVNDSGNQAHVERNKPKTSRPSISISYYLLVTEDHAASLKRAAGYG